MASSLTVRRVTFFLVLILAAAALPRTASAALPPPEVNGATGKSDHSVFVVGDSVLLGAADQIRTTLTGDGWEPTIATLPGLPLRVGKEVLRENLYRIGQVVVIHLGNNLPDTVEQYRAQVEETMSILAGVHAVIWLNIQPFAERRAQLDQILNEAATHHANMRVSDWAGAVARNPGWTTPDNPHLSGSGRRGMTQLIHDEVTQVRRESDRCAPSTSPGRSTAPGATAKLWVLDSAGAVHGVGAASLGDLRSRGDAAPAVGIAAVPGGYWIVDMNGRVEAFGSAPVLGDVRTVALATPIRRIVATPSGKGYWLLGLDGGVFALGDAKFAGVMPTHPGLLASALVSSGDGYWVANTDGKIQSFATAAPPDGYTPALTIGLARGAGGAWMVDAWGGVFSRGTSFYGALGTEGFCVAEHAAVIASTPSGRGYWVSTEFGAVAGFGDAPGVDKPVPLSPGSHVVDLAPVA
ncbi:MAG: estA [Acidimicrobiia bacterium]|nr:estA [Acidimicrobiia bacterium]